jgi:hypothetical protein
MGQAWCDFIKRYIETNIFGEMFLSSAGIIYRHFPHVEHSLHRLFLSLSSQGQNYYKKSPYRVSKKAWKIAIIF